MALSKKLEFNPDSEFSEVTITACEGDDSLFVRALDEAIQLGQEIYSLETSLADEPGVDYLALMGKDMTENEYNEIRKRADTMGWS